MARTKGLSPKVTGPFVAAVSAFAVSKIEDPPTEALVVAGIGVLAAIVLPAGEQTEEPTKNPLKRKKKPKKQVIEPVGIDPPVPPASPTMTTTNPDQELL